MWFEELTGFKEESPKKVRENLKIENYSFISTINNRKLTFGELEIPTLNQLREISLPTEIFKDKVSEVIADVQELHCQVENANALFQAASQFNLLEMTGPHITPEQGIDRYEDDHTQGPACAIACGAGTIYRNYFVKIGTQFGQTSSKQIDCLDLIGKQLGNGQSKLWTMKNGYAMINQDGLLTINKKLAQLTHEQIENLKGQLKIGIQWNSEVTISPTKHRVSQIYCSAIPVAYCQPESIYWERFARIILEATYEATLYTSLINLDKYGSNLVFLALVGGGAFGNEQGWILESLQKAIRKFGNTPLDIRVVSYGQSNPNLVRSINEL